MATWHVLYTKSGWEKRTAILCERKKIEVFVPTTAGNPDTTHGKVKSDPLFPCFVFASIRCEDYANILRVEGVLGLVHRLQQPLILQPEEIDAIRCFVLRHKGITLRPTGIGFGMSMYRSEDRLWLPSLGYVLMPSIKINAYETEGSQTP